MERKNGIVEANDETYSQSTLYFQIYKNIAQTAKLEDDRNSSAKDTTENIKSLSGSSMHIVDGNPTMPEPHITEMPHFLVYLDSMQPVVIYLFASNILANGVYYYALIGGVTGEY